jgi:catechol 2,3-dioxygenase-like lactoylglutathione lyase family enzyme
VEVLAVDHLVLTVADIEATVAFYEKLGMGRETFDEDRVALRFGQQKINLHRSGSEISPHAARATPGSGDLCFLVADTIEQVVQQLEQVGIEIELGPVRRTGAAGALTSVYVRDPDGNLVELSRPL